MSSLTPRIDRFQKNYLINGDMRIAQRGTSFPAIANAAYHLDRWRYTKSGAMVHTVSQGTDVPTLAEANYLFQNSMVVTLTTPDTSIAAGDLCTVGQKIEGYNFANIAQKDFTLSFWVKATLPGTYCVAFLSSNGDRSYIKEYTINNSNTWERKTLHIEASPSAGTWNYTNGAGLEVAWTIASGTTYQTTANIWQSGTYFATANQVNGVNTGATSFLITGAMISEGTLTDPEFVTFGKDFETEVAACQRYYVKTYELTTNPGSSVTAGASSGGVRAQSVNQGEIVARWQLPVKMRAVPISQIYSITGATGNIHDLSAAADRAAVLNSQNTLEVCYTNIGAVVNGNYHYWHMTAEAEL